MASSTQCARLPLRVVIGSDHGGYALKQELLAHVRGMGVRQVDDLGCDSATESVDYPDFGRKVAEAVVGDLNKTTGKQEGANIHPTIGIVVCGSGIGISIAANKVQGARCALCHDHLTAKLAREHNDANVLSLGGRTTGVDVAKDIVATFLTTEFSNGERHLRRISQL